MKRTDGGISILPLAKVNLALHVGAVLPDGYHPVDTVCVFVPGGDRLTLVDRHAVDAHLAVDGPFADGLSGSGNFIVRAARAFSQRTGNPAGAWHLSKGVPPASGIAGGTSNGTAALAVLNRAHGEPLEEEGLMNLAQQLGADGAVCMAPFLGNGNVWRARGYGERIDALGRFQPLGICLANPNEAVPTGPVFSDFDRHPQPEPFALPHFPTRANVSDLGAWIDSTRNDLEPPAIAIAPRIGALGDDMRARPGCIAGRMSGSGATVFGLFANAAAARRAARHFKSRGYWAVGGHLSGREAAWAAS